MSESTSIGTYTADSSSSVVGTINWDSSSTWLGTSSTVYITVPYCKEKSKDQLEGEDFKRLIMYQGLKILNIQLENGQIIINCKLGKEKFKIRINGNLSLEDLKGKIMDEIFKPLEYVPITPTVIPTITYPYTYYDTITNRYNDTYTTGGI